MQCVNPLKTPHVHPLKMPQYSSVCPAHACHDQVTEQVRAFMMEKPPPSTFSLSMARMTSSSVMGSALDPLRLWSSREQEICQDHRAHFSKSEVIDNNTCISNLSHQVNTWAGVAC